jgi:glycosyltransferase involved in cell wall biosynthesis
LTTEEPATTGHGRDRFLGDAPARQLQGERILLTINTPWLRNLGAPQAMMELGEALSRAGHRVEKFSLEDAFPGPPSGRSATLLQRLLGGRPSFARRLGEFVRENAARFDIIDANQTDLPWPRHALGFDKLLVCRSVGLVERYLENDLWSRRRWPRAGSLRLRLADARALRQMRSSAQMATRSLRVADLVNVSNSDDVEYLVERGWDRQKIVSFPLGLTGKRRAELREAAVAREAGAARSVAFIGTWNYRKGAGDWPEIVARVRSARPEARFLFLGVGIPARRVLERFAAEDRPALTVVERYTVAELPGLLARAQVGAFPGYLEGFGLGVLEMLASGLPVVAYDAPGPHDILADCPASTLTPAGEAGTFAARLVEMLGLDSEILAGHSATATRWSARFDWDAIAALTVDEYRRRLSSLGRIR